MTTTCPCCLNRGKLPHPKGYPELVTKDVVLRMCDACIGAAFLGHLPHPHPVTKAVRRA